MFTNKNVHLQHDKKFIKQHNRAHIDKIMDKMRVFFIVGGFYI